MWADSLLLASGWDGSRDAVLGASKLFLSSTPELQLLSPTPPLGASGASAEEATDHLGALFFFLTPQYSKQTQARGKKQQTTETGNLINMQRGTRTNLHPKLVPIIRHILCRSGPMAAERCSAGPNCPGARNAMCQRPTVKKKNVKKHFAESNFISSC